MRRNGERKGPRVFITLIKEELELIARGALATRLKRRGTRAVLLGAKAAGLGVRY